MDVLLRRGMEMVEEEFTDGWNGLCIKWKELGVLAAYQRHRIKHE